MLDHLKNNNRAWVERMISADAGFFRRLEGQQAPEYLWIGCSDSRVPANDIVGLDPNVANLAPPQDANDHALDAIGGRSGNRSGDLRDIIARAVSDGPT